MPKILGLYFAFMTSFSDNETESSAVFTVAKPRLQGHPSPLLSHRVSAQTGLAKESLLSHTH